ncbi:MAG: TlyA family RNA methyltransferase [Deltaproteobacteria bacterium]|nr:TlyA family RNA methyltransferase [Deltaproteobacteria bacterium]
MSGIKKVRADLLLVEHGLAESRHQAAALILAGRVWTSSGRVEKAGQLLDPAVPLTFEEGEQFVSRGGLKLNSALDHFQINPNGFVCLDSGASTGGFTDCLLQRGTKKIYAVDVGHGQLHPKLREDPRVVVLEKTNLRHLTALHEKIDLAVLDLSFISLTKVLEKVCTLLKEGGHLLALVKPQFELSPKEVKKGVVRDEALREKAVQRVMDHAKGLGMTVRGRVDSSLPGPKGNREIFLWLNK